MEVTNPCHDKWLISINSNIVNQSSFLSQLTGKTGAQYKKAGCQEWKGRQPEADYLPTE